MKKSITFLQKALFILLVCLVAVPESFAQDIQYGRRYSDAEANATGYYFFTDAQAPTILIHIWGSVGAPGMYEVEEGTDLRMILELSGTNLIVPGPGVKATTIVKMLRQTGSAQRPVFESTMKELIFNPPSSYPVLQEGDVVTVEANVRQVLWRDVLSITTTVFAGILLFLRVKDTFSD